MLPAGTSREIRAQEAIVIVAAHRLTHQTVCRLANLIFSCSPRRIIVIDTTGVADATTSAYARMVLLRRALLQQGQDLRLRGLHGRAARLYEIERLHRILPRG